MKFIPLLLIGALTFGLCFLVDKGFSKLFRGKAQHKSGKAVRLQKRPALFGLVLIILGILAVMTGIPASRLLIIGGIVVFLMGVGLIVYYLSFGVFYDEEGFLLTTFGRKSTEYAFRDIQGQKLYTVTGGGVIVELHLSDGRTVGLQSSMDGVYPFLDHAFSAWCRQKEITVEDCEFHDPSGSHWFPTMEDI
jgi:hypothetical protein